MNESFVQFFVNEVIQQNLEICLAESIFLRTQANILRKTLYATCNAWSQLPEPVQERSFDVALNFIGERLHTGHWSSVRLFWRHAYSYFALLKGLAVVKFSQDEKRAIEILDYGLILGGDIGSNVLSNLAQFLHDATVQKDPKLEVSTTWGDKVCEPTEEEDFKIKEEILKKSQPSLMEFLHLISTEEPFVILDSLNHWPALSRWNIGYILEKCKYRHVPIEIGSKYSDDDWTQKIMPIHKFVADYFSTSASQKAYLAQHDFLKQVPCLRDDVSIPDYCFMTPPADSDLMEEDESSGQQESKPKGEVVINSWFGPAGTVSPLHQDPRRNLLCQVFGRKYIVLIPASDSAFVYAASDDPLLLNTSRVDVEQPDLQQFPLFSRARQLKVVLNPGEMLYIPPKCWHFVKSLDPSFSLSFWFD